jgi:hypothetical protein
MGGVPRGGREGRAPRSGTGAERPGVDGHHDEPVVHRRPLVKTARWSSVLLASVAVGALAVGACGSSQGRSIPAGSAPIQATISYQGPHGVAPSCLADYCAGLPGGGPSPDQGLHGMAPSCFADYCAGLLSGVEEPGGARPRGADVAETAADPG